MSCKCGHDGWDHDMEESYDSYFFFGPCEECDCPSYEEEDL